MHQRWQAGLKDAKVCCFADVQILVVDNSLFFVLFVLFMAFITFVIRCVGLNYAYQLGDGTNVGKIVLTNMIGPLSANVKVVVVVFFAKFIYLYNLDFFFH